MTRREFMLRSAVYGSSLWMLLNTPRPRALRAAQETARREVLSEAEWKTVEAITGRIIPTDHEPGAIEANCVNFIDKALAHEDAKMKPLYKKGLAGLDAVSKRRFAKPFVDLSSAQQDEILAALESGKAAGWPRGDATAGEFFTTVREHTLIGFLADPKYGGNRDYVGWKVVGYPGGGHHLGGYSPAQLIGKEKIKTAWGEEV
ncbi:MAG: gluconate 2-dehydrogenase subunit 3 family protein [Deltaproteobacteria bacterium]|nr:gluconate 2-dehydrogenase subunit 3 family protein [Deltaproteobacteria bacterium]